MHKFLDDLFFEYFGWKARSEGVFCSTILTPHNVFKIFGGMVYIVFPKNGFKYLYDEDPISNIYGILYSLFQYREGDIISSSLEKELRQHISRMKDNSLASHLLKKYEVDEIIVKCDNYYCIKNDADNRRILFNYLKD